MRDKNRFLCKISCDIQKTVKMDSFAYEIINRYRGSNFSEKLRNYVFDVENKRHDHEKKSSANFL